MVLDEGLASFLEEPVMIIVGTQADGYLPEIARAAGAVLEADRAALHLMVSARQWPETIANLRANRRITVTFSRPADYETYQLKGTVTAIAPPTLEQQARATRYLAEIGEVLAGFGLAPEISAPWRVARDLLALRFVPEAVFVQTPGATAGQKR
ncbi:pyridoxamine 5'-phosphate oxidase family protein [Pseudoroseomonas aestuarii]|uniref:pyridoxamine 5'-phosphate oxidase family protein n=1 Tax=Teichococcus aestuarii TaxID=568898 RepID=UPI00361702B7